MTEKLCFPPVVDHRTRLMILGSLPGEQSLAAGRYYANPRNQFWRLIATVIDVGLEKLPYEERLCVLLEAGVGLWDVVASAQRPGSLDSAIRNARENDLAALAGTLPALAAVGFNGGKASDMGRPLLAASGAITMITLPSSSPALTWPLERKAAAWSELRLYL